MDYRREEIIEKLRKNSNKKTLLGIEYLLYQVGFVSSGVIGSKIYLDNSHWLLPQMDTISPESVSICSCIAIYHASKGILENFDIKGRLADISKEREKLDERLRKLNQFYD